MQASRHPLDHLGKLPHYRRILWTAEIKAVGETERSRTDTSKIARRFGDG